MKEFIYHHVKPASNTIFGKGFLTRLFKEADPATEWTYNQLVSQRLKSVRDLFV